MAQLKRSWQYWHSCIVCENLYGVHLITRLIPTKANNSARFLHNEDFTSASTNFRIVNKKLKLKIQSSHGLFQKSASLVVPRDNIYRVFSKGRDSDVVTIEIIVRLCLWCIFNLTASTRFRQTRRE